LVVVGEGLLDDDTTGRERGKKVGRGRRKGKRGMVTMTNK